MNHEYFMQLALDEAEKGEGIVSPNPHVGSVLVKDGKVVVKGYHREMGKLHAERVVFEKVKNVETRLIASLQECVLYVTLEPCCHHGKTPPCTDAILESGIKKVVIAQTDPNPLVSGKGIQILRDAGIEVIEGILEKEAQHQIRFFRHEVVHKESYFVGKLAVSVNNFYAPDSGVGTTQKIPPAPFDKVGDNKNYFLISSEETKKRTRKMRKAFDGILIGKKTLLQDNPYLGFETDSGVGTTPESKLLRIILCHTADFSVKNLQAFRDKNVIIVCNQKTEACDFAGEFLMFRDLKDLKQKLYKRGLQSILVEGGGEVLRSFLDADLLNEFHLVKSKNVKLKSGLSFRKLPENFQKIKEEDFGEDVLGIFIKK